MGSVAFTAETDDFSLILGGPLYQLFRRAHLTDTHLEFLARRVIALSLVAWLPLLVLSVMEGKALGDSVKMPFLYDIDVHARFLIALPLFILAELVVHQRMRVVVREFLNRGLVPESARAEFDTAIDSAMQLRNSIVAELLLFVLVYVVGIFVVWRSHGVVNATAWYGAKVDGKLNPSLAGWWFSCLSLPLVQFILVRWYYRIFIWARFLWHVSRIELKLQPLHPDRCGGLGFLSNITYAFAPLLMGQGVLLAGVMANKIFYAGAKLPEFYMELVTLVAVVVFMVITPVLVFTRSLERCKREGLAVYGRLAQRYVYEFDQKWLRGGAPPDENLLGSSDIQSLADIGNSYEVVKGMKWVPFTRQTIIQLVVVTLLPVLPLVLTMIPLSELLSRLFKAMF
jgi:hypothetical protein